MIRYMENNFLPLPVDLKKRCQREEKITISILLGLLVLIFFLFIVETCLPFSQIELDQIRKLYDKKYPERILPITNPWLPFIDSSESGPYKVLYVYSMFIGLLILVSVAYCVLQITLFITPVEGQFRILSKHVAQLGREPQDPLGTYVLTSVGIFALDSRIINKRSKNSFHLYQEYNDMCAIQCVKYSQVLYEFLEKYRVFNQILRDRSTVLTLSTTVIIVVMRTANLSQLSYQAIIKSLVEFALVITSSCCIIRQSERFQTCQDLIRAGVTRCGYHNVPPCTQKTLCMMLLRADRMAKLTFLKGVYVVDTNILLKLFKLAYSFLNFMHVAKINKIK
ncbi:hypothetical protein WDU94_006103 [Cyamophila willieti]